MDEEILQSNAIAFAKKERKHIAKELTDPSKFRPEETPISVFMAGSPGAGKTEFSKNIISILEQKEDRHVVRIDGDDIRKLLPGYTGSNSYLFQGAISLIVEKIHDCALSQGQTFVLDGTFSNFEKAVDNINRFLKRGRPVFIFYVYQNPKTAWYFTQKREEAEGRNIPKDAFIDQFFGARETVNQIRANYDEEVTIFLVKKDFEKNSVDEIVGIKPGVVTIDEHTKNRYTKSDLGKIL